MLNSEVPATKQMRFGRDPGSKV